MIDLRVWPDKTADENPNTSTPRKSSLDGKNQIQILNKLTNKHFNGLIPKVEWLDRLTYREIEIMFEFEKRVSDYLNLTLSFLKFRWESTFCAVL